LAQVWLKSFSARVKGNFWGSRRAARAMAFRLPLALCLGALARGAAVEEACDSEDAEEMVALQVHKANGSSLPAPPPPCGYAAFLDSHCRVSGKSHATLVQAKAACSAEARCTGVFDGSGGEAGGSEFWLCEASRPLPGEGTVHLRGPRDECSSEEMEFLQQPFRVPKVNSGVALEQQGGCVQPPAGYQCMPTTTCFYPSGTVYPDLSSAAAACNGNPHECAGIYNGIGVPGQPQGYSQCIAPNHNFGCGSWYQGGYQGITYWKSPNPYNNECQ